MHRNFLVFWPSWFDELFSLIFFDWLFFCTPWKQLLRHLFQVFKVIMWKNNKKFLFLKESAWIDQNEIKICQSNSAECCFCRKSRFSTPILFMITCYFLKNLFTLKFCSIFVVKNKVTRDFHPTQEHYWEGFKYIKVYIRVFFTLEEER